MKCPEGVPHYVMVVVDRVVVGGHVGCGKGAKIWCQVNTCPLLIFKHMVYLKTSLVQTDNKRSILEW